MAITTIKIHPAIGIARVGNSPDEFFVGPEKPWDRTPPPGGYKDSQCRIKRQAARFRLFAYDGSGALVKEITTADGQITWTAHLVNRKAAAPIFNGTPLRNPTITNPADRAALVIDSGARTLVGANQIAKFDTGKFKLPGGSATVLLGEIRTDADARLIVLGGHGKSGSPINEPLNSLFDNADWYDDIADGPINATVKIGATTFTAVGGWVVVAPPKYAPPVDNVITLYDRLYDYHVKNSLLTAPATPSYTQHIYPILLGAAQIAAVETVPSYAHMWPHPITDAGVRSTIFFRLKAPNGGGGNMPALADGHLNDGRLTATQYQIMEKWKNGTFTNDWAGTPAPDPNITPQGMDRAALENCVGGAFHPGIEAGEFLVSNTANFSEPFRFNHSTVKPGDVTAQMALPWQTDFLACGTNWWPPARPNRIQPEGSAIPADWHRGVANGTEMIDEWHTLGFVVKQGSKYVEVDRCDSTYINLLTPSLNFVNVPQGPMGMSRKQMLAVAFEVQSGAAVTLEILTPPTHPRIKSYLSSTVTVGPTSGSSVVTARLWLTYETGAVGESVTNAVTIRHTGSSRQWMIPIYANTVARKKAAIALALDRSGSMSQDRGDGVSKIESLREAGKIFVDVMLQDDGIALVRYDQDAQIIQSATALGGLVLDPGRENTKNILSGPQLDPAGATSIGDGIFEARGILDGLTGYDVKGLVVLTDGVENRSRWISDVGGLINAQTYAIGLGTAQNTSAAALQRLSGNNGGYLLLTGAIAGDNRFLLQKYFLQILAGISNADIVLDPQGELRAGDVHRIPFPMTEADAGMDVILLSPYPQYINFRLQTPSGGIVDPPFAASHPGVVFVQSQGVSYYRLRLPVEYMASRFDDRGTWHAILEIGRPSAGIHGGAFSTSQDAVFTAASTSEVGPAYVHTGAHFASMVSRREYPVMAQQHENFQRRTGLPYSLLVHSYSDISFRATATQTSFEPGTEVNLYAEIRVNTVAMDVSAEVWADIAQPAGGIVRVDLKANAPGQYAASFKTTAAGQYSIRIQASGKSPLGWPFRRERTLIAVVWLGGDQDANRDPRDPRDSKSSLCELLECLVKTGAVSEQFRSHLKEEGIDLRKLQDCLCGERARHHDEG